MYITPLMVVVLFALTVTKGLLSRPLQIKAEEELLARALAQGPKTVNVPASLPTPPHNNQEDLRSVRQASTLPNEVLCVLKSTVEIFTCT